MYKKLSFLILFIIIVIFAQYGIQTIAEPKILTQNQFEEKLTKYQYKKNTSELYPILKYISSSNLLENKHSQAPMEGFFMGVKHDTPTEFRKLKTQNISNQTIKMLNRAEQFSPDMEAILDNKIKYYPESPAFLDTLWGYFYATGDSRVTNKFCYIIKNDKSPLIKGAAEWSYKSNMKTFPDKIKECK